MALVVGFTACSEDGVDYQPGEFAEGPQAYFPNDAQTSFSVGADDSSVTLPVNRVETTGALDVPVLVTVAEGNEGLFDAPTSVSFADGAESTSLSVTFDYTTLVAGTTYEVKLKLDDPTLTTPYASSEVTVAITVPEPYVLKGTATIWDGLVYTLFTGGVSDPYEVEVYEHLEHPGYLYFKNAYTKAYPTSYFVDFGMSEDEVSQYVSYPEEDVYFVLNVTDPNCVILPLQSLGLNVSYGTMVAGMLSDAGAGTVEDCAGTLKNGVITFPPKTLIIADDDGTYYGNSTGGFKIALPGAVLTDFSLEVEAAGHVADSSGNASPVVNVVAGADVAGVAVGFVAGDVTADYASVVEAIVAEPVLTNVVEGACTVVGTEPMEAGLVTAVVVPFDANGVAQTEDAVAVAFYFTGCGAEAPACELEAYLFPYTQFWDADEQYSDANSVAIGLMGTEIKLCSFSLWDTESFDYYTAEGYGLDAFVDPDPEGEDAVPAEYIDGYINDGGLVMSFRGLPSEMEFILVAWAQNVYGSETYVTSNRLSTTAVAAAAASAKAHFNGQGMLKSMQRVDLKLTWTKREIK